MKGETGPSMYDIAKKAGYEGTEEEWVNALLNAVKLEGRVSTVENHLEWKEGMGG